MVASSATVAVFRLAAEDTLLPETFERVPDVRFDLETAISARVPSFWVTGVDARTIEAAFDADPTVDAFDRLAATDGGLLYDLDIVDPNTRFTDLIRDDAVLLEAIGADGWWRIKLRVRDRDALTRIHDRIIEREINADLCQVTNVTDAASGLPQLTPEQFEALELALERGYFEIPRRASMEDLADELGISHQALSERLRRAYGTLVGATLQPTSDAR